LTLRRSSLSPGDGMSLILGGERGLHDFGASGPSAFSPLGKRCPAKIAAMASWPRAAVFAMVGVGADEHAAALVVEDDFVEIDVLGAAQRAGLVEMLDFEGMILEIEADDLGVGRHRIDALLAAGAEQLQRLRHVHLRIVEFRRRRRVHDVAALDLDRIGIGRGDAAVAGDVLVELHMHEAVFLERMHLARLGLARLEEAQRFGDRHLIDQHLAGPSAFGNAVARLDDRRIAGARGHRDIGDLLEEGADRDGVGRVVGALVDDLQHVVRPMIAAVTCTPPVPQP
jgi:hypothetical protein